MNTPLDEASKYILEYVESQTRDESDPVKLVQKVGSRRVLGRLHELYDVWMEKGGRWWVIDNPTNLYSQERFNSIDDAFTYHIGVSLVLGEKSRSGQGSDENDVVSGAQRRYQRAVEAMDDAVEAEDFQAVGIKCREALLAWVRENNDADWTEGLDDLPKNSDFKGWASLWAENLSVGRVRSYLKSIAEKTWDLTVWLQHYVDASEWDAELVLQAARQFFDTFALAKIRAQEGDVERCPTCDSYRVAEDGGYSERDGQPGSWIQNTCLACGWRGEELWEAYSREHLLRVAEYLGIDVSDEEVLGIN